MSKEKILKLIEKALEAVKVKMAIEYLESIREKEGCLEYIDVIIDEMEFPPDEHDRWVEASDAAAALGKTCEVETYCRDGIFNLLAGLVDEGKSKEAIYEVLKKRLVEDREYYNSCRPK